MRRALLIIVSVLSVAITAPAQAKRAPHVASARPAIAAGNLPGCLDGSLSDPQPLMRSMGATILRVVVSPPYGADGEAIPCISAARSEGYRVMLVVQWNSSWPLSHTKSFFEHVLSLYGPYLWAVGIGNEQEITPHLTGPRYSRAWRSLEPIAKAIAPHAIRVGGEISPWGMRFLRDALRWGLPGIQALAVHPYAYKWAFTVRQALKLAARYHQPLWCDEGLYDGPDTWHPHRTLRLSAMRGVAVTGVWER
jgi:hypothetical protein